MDSERRYQQGRRGLKPSERPRSENLYCDRCRPKHLNCKNHRTGPVLNKSKYEKVGAPPSRGSNVSKKPLRHK